MQKNEVHSWREEKSEEQENQIEQTFSLTSKEGEEEKEQLEEGVRTKVFLFSF
jgi:hypothetical protein